MNMVGTKNNWPVVLGLALMILFVGGQTAQAARIKDIARIDGVRDNQLIGYGLVGGLAGTGDDPKAAPYTAEAIANMMAAMGFVVDAKQLKVKNFASVMVTADLPAYTREGDRLDITISSAGSAKSLKGGILYQTLLRGADGKIYAVGQGSVSLGTTLAGSGSGGGSASEHTTVGRIPGGALVENSVPSSILKGDGAIHLNLGEPDFTTANAVADAINASLGTDLARAEDAGSVSILVPLDYIANLVPFVALVENLDVTPGSKAKVIVNQRTGTVVLGHNVSILPVTVTHGTLTLSFGGSELIAPTDPQSTEPAPALAIPGQETNSENINVAGASTPATAQQVADGLSKMNLGAPDIVAIFEAISAAGALLGELEIL